MEHLTDQALVRKTLGGDREAFAEIVVRYQRQVYSLTYRLTNDPEDAKDLAQEVFIHLYRVLDKYDPQRQFFSWMYKIAANVCYTALRKKPQEAVPLDKVIEFAPLVPRRDAQPEEYSEAREVQRLVQKALAELPEKYRMPLILRYLEDFTYQQIADFLELPVTTIETRLYRGKALLQKRLALILERGALHELSRS